MKTTKTTLLALSALFLAAGCASNKERSAVETVQSAKNQVTATDDLIIRADKTFSAFEKDLDKLRKEAEGNAEMRGKDRYLHALSGFDIRLAGARSELSELKHANARSWEKYRARLQDENSDLNRNFKESLGE